VKVEIVLSILIAISLIGGLCFSNATAAVKPQVPYHFKLMEHHEAEQQQKEAERLWEQAIAAKGGRDRLYAVRNMVISTEKDTSSLFTKNKVRREELLVFPNKSWFWDDYRPDVFGLRVSMYNYDSNMSYVISDGEPYHQAEPIKNAQKNKALRNGQLSFLLETKWLKPTILKASTGRVGLRSVDIVQTTVEGERVDFAFDRKTHLPVRVSYHDVVKGKTYVNVQSFSDYKDVAGIKVPQRLEYYEGSKYRASFQFNVEYNENIFIKPLPLEAGPEAWRSKRKS
jgi:hypothetical protein